MAKQKKPRLSALQKCCVRSNDDLTVGQIAKLLNVDKQLIKDYRAKLEQEAAENDKAQLQEVVEQKVEEDTQLAPLVENPEPAVARKQTRTAKSFARKNGTVSMTPTASQTIDDTRGKRIPDKYARQDGVRKIHEDRD